MVFPEEIRGLTISQDGTSPAPVQPGNPNLLEMPVLILGSSFRMKLFKIPIAKFIKRL
jgi:hypothetical protein